ncbi:hypothetical protein [Lentzea cavernae]|uniref:FtsK domain-containing protein n=1 Tax=Lentzea cavernae TaxID=2020703 RepID=A0ABQ3MR26_9PSEU|nr:hypothetical protein [Lentzea cavernae]GHH57674.1 hypothetical protein GCM10017774_77600 [Lentzea cavernae]
MPKKPSKAVEAVKDRAVAQATSRGSVVVRPVVGMVCELGASAALWGFASPEVLPWMTPALALSTAGLTGLVWHVGRDRTPAGRVLAIGTTALTGTHLIASSIVGPFATPLIQIWGWLGGTTVVAWAVRLWVARSDAHLEDGKKQVSLWDQATAKVGGALEGSVFKAKQVTADSMSGQLQLEPGATVKNAQSSLEELESVLGLPVGGATLSRDRSHAARGELTLMRRDVLADPLPYRGPSVVGGSVAQPYRVGRYAHGRDAFIQLHIPGFGEVHLIIQGMTGSGKTKGAHQLFAEEFTRVDGYTIYVDTVKGAQSLGPLARGIKWAMRTEAEAKALMKVLKNKIIPLLSQYLGQKGLDCWEPGCGFPRISVHVEEGAGLFLGNEAFVRVLERARSVGIQVRLSAQRFSYTSLPTDARAQFGAVLCYGVKDVEDAKFAMPDHVFDAGADPSLWQNEQPGCNYLVAPGVSAADQVTGMRTEKTERAELERLAEYQHQHGADLPDWLAEAFGELHESRVPVEVQMSTAPPSADVDEGDDEDDDVLFGEDAPRAWAPSEEEPEPDVQPAGIDEPIERVDGGGMRFGDRGTATPEEARALFEQRLLELHREGREEVRAADMVEVARAAGRSPAWVYKQLNGRVDSGHMSRTDTGFRFERALEPA